jgi:hypothetical protein
MGGTCPIHRDYGVRKGRQTTKGMKNTEVIVKDMAGKAGEHSKRDGKRPGLGTHQIIKSSSKITFVNIVHFVVSRTS